jgi:hypothetical protein
MSFSASLPLNAKYKSITFFDGSMITSGRRSDSSYLVSNQFEVRETSTFQGLASFLGGIYVEGDITVTGPIPYVDNQTGWGLPEWTFAGAQYNKETDSLVVKIYRIEELLETTYVTQSELQSATSLNQGLIHCDPGTYPLYNTSGYYNKVVTHLASDSYFIIRDDINFSQIFQFQRGDVQIGKYLRCADDAGTVEWAEITTTIPTISGVTTTNGQTSQNSFYIVDSGENGNGVNRGFYFIPNYALNAQYNDAAQAGDILMLAGLGGTENGSTQFNSLIGVYNGKQALRFQSDYTISGANILGATSLYGAGHRLQLDSTGVTVGETTTDTLFNIIGRFKFTSSISTLNKVLSSVVADGTITWNSIDDIFPSTITKAVTFSNDVTFSDDLSFTKNLPQMTTSKTYILANDGLTGKVRWITNLTTPDGNIENPVNMFQDLTLYNQMIFVDVDFGLLTAAAVGGIAYAIGQGQYAGQTKFSQYWSSNNANLDFIWRYDEPQNTPQYVYPFRIQKRGIITPDLRVAKAYPPSSDYGTYQDVAFELSNTVLTDNYTVTINGLSYMLYASPPAKLCLAGDFLYRQPDITGGYFIPTAGDVLVNWGGVTYSYSARETYGVAQWKKLSDILPRSIVYDQYFENDVLVGSEVNYSIIEYGITRNVQKNKSDLRIFGKFFYRIANLNTDVGSSPLGYILQCINASTGEVGWAPNSPSLPSNATFNSIAVTTLNATTTNTGVLNASGISTFTGAFSVQNSVVSFPLLNPGVNKILTCTNGTTGECQWQDASAIGYPQNPTFLKVTTNSLEIPLHSETLYPSSKQTYSYPENYEQIITVKYENTGQEFNSTNFFPQRTENLNNKQIYSYFTALRETYMFLHEANCSEAYQFYVPVSLYHNWKFRDNANGSGATQSEAFYYTVDYIEYKLKRAIDLAEVSGDTKGFRHEQSATYYRRDNGPYNNTADFSFEFFMGCIPLYISIPPGYRDITSNWTVYTSVHMKFYYRGEYIKSPVPMFGVRVMSPTPPTNFTWILIDNGVDITNNHTNDLYPMKWGAYPLNNFPYYEGTLNPPPYFSVSVPPLSLRHSKTGYQVDTNLTSTSVTNLHTNWLSVNYDIFTPNGTVTAMGFRCRPGVGSNTLNDQTNSRLGSSSGTRYFYHNSSTFNLDWPRVYPPDTNSLDFYIDTTLVHRLTPNFCDYRLKNEMEPLPNILEKVSSIEVFKYNRRGYGAMTASENHIGIIADSLQSVFPEYNNLVVGIKDGIDEENKPIYQTLTNEIQFLLLKSIQELKREVDLLKEEIIKLRLFNGSGG